MLRCLSVRARHRSFLAHCRLSFLAVVLALAAAPDLLVTGSALAGSAGHSSIGHRDRSPTGAPMATAVSEASPGYGWPLAAPVLVLRGFTPPATRYGPGHLGVDLAAPRGSPVLAAGPGVVRFAGPVAGRGVIVVAHADGVSTEYEPVTPSARVGSTVLGGSVLGTVSVPRHRGCEVSCLHWGARRDGRYLDPRELLEPLAPVRLLPTACGRSAAPRCPGPAA